jgi:hypothetical protein
MPAFVPVEIGDVVGRPAVPIASDAPAATLLATTPVIEIMTGTMTVRVPTGVDAATLATVMAILRVLA